MLNSAGLCVTADEGESAKCETWDPPKKVGYHVYNLLLAGRLEAEHWVSRMAKWQLTDLRHS